MRRVTVIKDKTTLITVAIKLISRTKNTIAIYNQPMLKHHSLLGMNEENPCSMYTVRRTKLSFRISTALSSVLL